MSSRRRLADAMAALWTPEPGLGKGNPVQGNRI